MLTEPITRRELDILRLLVDNLSNKEIASQLTLSANSVKWYVKQIYAKLGVNERYQVAARAMELGLLGKAPLPAAPKHNLPALMAPFIGRQSQVAQVKQMVSDPNCRLITLTGAGGVGKTRLALKVAEASLNIFQHGVWLVELASINDPNLVDDAINGVFSLTPSPNELTSLELLREYLHEKNLLLILDNCEHLIDVCANLANAFLRYCPQLKILVTSREGLGVEGETPFSVPSLTFPDPKHMPPLEALLQYESVHLFIERARSYVPDFALTDANAVTIARICKRLDGIPLAIELAAARVKVLSLDQIMNRLEESFQLLSGGFRTALPRHQTMRASISWSFQLLSDEERALLCRFSVFSGGWTLEGSEVICADEVPTAITILDRLNQLVNKSLVTVESGPGHSIRYYLLDAIWDFTQEKLNESGTVQSLRNRHLAYFLDLSETAEPELYGQQQVAWLDRLGQELSNFRSALDWGLKTDPESALRLATALRMFWHIRGRWSEGLDWLSKGLAATVLDETRLKTGDGTPLEDVHAHIRAKALATAGFLHRKSLNHHKATPLLEESLSLFRNMKTEDIDGIAFTLLELAGCATSRGNKTQANKFLSESQALYIANRNKYGMSECLLAQGNSQTDPRQAKRLFLEGLAIKRQILDINGLAYTLQLLAEITVFETDFDKAYAWLEESLDYYAQASNKKAVANNLHNLAWIAWVTGRYPLALVKVEEALVISQDILENYFYATNLLLRCDINFSQGCFDDCNLDIQKAIVVGQTINDPSIAAAAQVKEGRKAWIQGLNDHALALLQDALVLGRESGNKDAMAFSCYYLGKVACMQKQLELAKSYYQQSMQLFFEMNFWLWDYIAYAMEGMAELALIEQQPEKTARLYGAANRLFGLITHTLSPIEREQREKNINLAQSILGTEKFDFLWQEGFRLTTEQALQLV
jgi:predicted ATPase/DNA-binding CsgD family transcriptional regulator